MLNESTVSEGAYSKTVVSRALLGKALENAVLRERQDAARDRKKKYPPLVDPQDPLPNAEPTKTSTRRSGILSCYSACTNRGIVRSYN